MPILEMTEDETIILGIICCVGNAFILGQANRVKLIQEALETMQEIPNGRAVAGAVSKKLVNLLE
jgi:hypothetical protein